MLERKDCKWRQRKGNTLNGSACEGHTLARRKEGTILEHKEKYYFILVFSFWMKWAVLCMVDIKGGKSLIQSNTMKNRTREWYVELAGQSWVPGKIMCRQS